MKHESMIEVIEPGSNAHQVVEHSIKASGGGKKEATRIYNELAEAYNSSEVGAYITLTLSHATSSTIKKTLMYRGLSFKTDFDLHRPALNARGGRIPVRQRPLVIHKLSAQKMRVA